MTGIFFNGQQDIPMTKIINSVLADVGLITWPPFIKDRLFLAALLSGAVVWAVIWFAVAPTFLIAESSLATIIFLAVVWHPVLEEIIFRGVVQSTLLQKAWGKQFFAGLSAANWLASLLFVLAHLFFQPWMWAVLVLIPSLVYGFFRDKCASIYPCIILHAFYNGGFVAINIIAQ